MSGSAPTKVRAVGVDTQGNPRLTCAALELAEEYGIKLWIAALLDPEPITHGTGDPAKSISSPPPFDPPIGRNEGTPSGTVLPTPRPHSSACRSPPRRRSRPPLIASLASTLPVMTGRGG